MLHAFWSVLLDLWQFLWGRRLPIDSYVLPEGIHPLSLHARPVTEKILEPTPLFSIGQSTRDEATFPTTLPLHHETSNASVYVQAGTIYFVSSDTGTQLLREAGVHFDSMLMHLRFGQSISLRRFVGQYAEVLAFGLTGYVRKEDITPHVATVWPLLQQNVVYEYDDRVTQLARLHLHDDFLAGALMLPLQPSEYVSLRLLRDQLVIQWPKVRPRTVGTWHILLRGVTGVHSSVTPVSDSIMEWVADDGEGRLAYVDAVLPDDTLKISAVGLMVAGEYTESVVPSIVWREWRPVFISIR